MRCTNHGSNGDLCLCAEEPCCVGWEVAEPSSVVLGVPNTQWGRDLGGTLCQLLEACCPALHLQEVAAVDDKIVLGRALFRVVLIGDRKHGVFDERGFGGGRARELWRRRTGLGWLDVLFPDSRHCHLEHVRVVIVLCRDHHNNTKDRDDDSKKKKRGGKKATNLEGQRVPEDRGFSFRAAWGCRCRPR